MAEKRVGVLTGGGDAPGLNPAIKGLVYRGSEVGLEVIGLFDGWRSLINPAPDVLPLGRETNTNAKSALIGTSSSGGALRSLPERDGVARGH